MANIQINGVISRDASLQHLAIKKPCQHGRDTSTTSRTTASICKVLTPDSRCSVRSRLIEALVDYKKRFLDLEIGWPGSVGDCRIFENSYLNGKYEEELAKLGTAPLMTGEDINEEIPAFILGDSAYRNSRQVEHTFGLLKGWFQVFEKPLRSAREDLPFSVYLIASIYVIHNFLIDARDTVPEADILRAAAERNGGVVEDDVDDDEIGGAREQNYERATREAFVRHIRWLDEEDEV